MEQAIGGLSPETLIKAALQLVPLLVQPQGQSQAAEAVAAALGGGAPEGAWSTVPAEADPSDASQALPHNGASQYRKRPYDSGGSTPGRGGDSYGSHRRASSVPGRYQRGGYSDAYRRAHTSGMDRRDAGRTPGRFASRVFSGSNATRLGTRKKTARVDVQPQGDPPPQLVEAAITEIKALLLEVPDEELLRGGAVVPPGWVTRYKPALGSYKRFVEQHPSEFTVTMEESGNYFVTLSLDATAPSDEALKKARDNIRAAQDAEGYTATGMTGTMDAREDMPPAQPSWHFSSPARHGHLQEMWPAMATECASGSSSKARWHSALREAWAVYEAHTPPSLMSIDEFLGPLPSAGLPQQNVIHSSSSSSSSSTPATSGPRMDRHMGMGNKVHHLASATGGRAQTPVASSPSLIDVAPHSGPQPEAVIITQAKYGLGVNSVHTVIGKGKIQWKLAGGAAVPFDQEGFGWERTSGSGSNVEDSTASTATVPPAGVGHQGVPPESPGPPWVVIEHPEHPGQYYYFNEDTGHSVWEVPGDPQALFAEDPWSQEAGPQHQQPLQQQHHQQQRRQYRHVRNQWPRKKQRVR